LNVPAGKTVALIGKSGCGKSTIFSLLQRFYDPSSGDISISGTNLKDLNVLNYRKSIGTVTQDPMLFSGTIMSNIAYCAPDSTSMEQVIEAAKLANAHSFIESFEDGYNTEVGERGVQLSGGQKQRVAIARAIISKPKLLLLDEATSALDSESERLVQDALDRLLSTSREMTTVVIAHRLQTIRNADKIVVMQDGQVVEEGTHDVLIQADGGLYQNMVNRADINN
jgi:ATP-binding cassette subfamily B (MDR/TAP) protein 1